MTNQVSNLITLDGTHSEIIRRSPDNFSGFFEKKQIDIRLKIISVILLLFFIISTSKGEYLSLALYFIPALLLIVLFRPGFKPFLKRAALVFIFPLSAAIFIPFANKGTAIYKFDIGFYSLVVSDNGLLIFYTTLIKSLLSILVLAALVSSSSEIELFRGLGKLHFPKIMVAIMFMMHRYLFLLKDESLSGQRAINSRVFQKSYRTINKRFANLAGNLFIRSVDRSENIYKSMESRGFNGTFHMYYKNNNENNSGRFKFSEILFISLFCVLLALLKYLEMRVF